MRKMLCWKKKRTIKEMLPIGTHALFEEISSRMGEDFPVPIIGNVSPEPQMDLKLTADYGARAVSTIIDYFYESQESGESLDSNSISQLAEYLISIYGDKWIRSGAVLFSDYDPIHNYLDEWEDHLDRNDTLDGESLRTDNTSNARTQNLTEDYTRTNALQTTRTDNLSNSSTRTDNLSQGESGTDTNNETNSVWAFNSATAVNSDSNSSSGSDSRTTTNTGTQSTSGTNTGTQTTADTGTVHDVKTNTGTDTVLNTGTVKQEQDDIRDISQDRDGRHFGNIGNISTQKLILEELNLRKINLMAEIVRDVADEISIPVYVY